MIGLGLHQPDDAIAVTSLDPKDWKEDPVEEATRNGIGHRLKDDDPQGNLALLRKYYPLRARLKRFDGVLGFQAGVVLRFARVKRTPQRFPIEVWFSGMTGTGATKTVRVNYDSQDVELIGPLV